MFDATSVVNEQMPIVSKIYSNLDQPFVGAQTIQFYKVVDDLISSAPNTIDCKAGCNYCCFYHVMVTPLEVFTITEHIRRLPDAEQREVVDSVRQYVDRVKGLNQDQHIHTNIQCSFLKAGRCSIYAIRPIACRGHHSADVNVCRRTFDDVSSAECAPMVYQRKVVSTGMDNALLLLQKMAGREVAKYEFHAALFEALTNKASVKRWRSGKSAFPSVKNKSTLDEIR